MQLTAPISAAHFAGNSASLLILSRSPMPAKKLSRDRSAGKNRGTVKAAAKNWKTLNPKYDSYFAGSKLERSSPNRSRFVVALIFHLHLFSHYSAGFATSIARY